MREFYTELPDDFPEEVQELARQETAGTSTAFERATVLELFFRESGGFVYDAAASSGHSSLDLVSWLTDFESRNYRAGYCEQFATAMALMARTLNIPSRVVMGFAPGDVVDTNGDEYIYVRAKHGHAWVELYMPGQGWLPFDPTPRGDGINPSTVSELGFDPRQILRLRPLLKVSPPQRFPEGYPTTNSSKSERIPRPDYLWRQERRWRSGPWCYSCSSPSCRLCQPSRESGEPRNEEVGNR